MTIYELAAWHGRRAMGLVPVRNDDEIDFHVEATQLLAWELLDWVVGEEPPWKDAPEDGEARCVAGFAAELCGFGLCLGENHCPIHGTYRNDPQGAANG